MSHFLYWWLVVVGTIDTLLIAPALHRAIHGETVGRLAATLATLTGMVLVGLGRVTEPVITLPMPTAIGMVLVDTGLLVYAIYLPERGVLGLIRRRR